MTIEEAIAFALSGESTGGERTDATLRLLSACVLNLREDMSRIARYDQESIWRDDRDDAARDMLRIARVALGEEYEE